MASENTRQVLANRFRLGVTAGVLAMCLVAVLSLRVVQNDISLEETPTAGRTGHHEKSRRAMTPPVIGPVTTTSPDKTSQESTSAGLANPEPPVQQPSPTEGIVSGGNSRPAPSREVPATFPGKGHTDGTGAIVGKILLRGTPPDETRISVSDPRCGTPGVEGNSTTTFYRVAADGGLADVFIHVTGGLPEGEHQTPGSPVLIDQKNCWFFPYVSGAQTGQTILVRNSDRTLHNVHWTPAAPGNRESNRAQLPGGADQSYSFPSEETFLRLKCDVHPWMFAYVGVVRHPFFAVTDAKGEFTIRNLPEGEFTLNVAHRKTHPSGNGLAIQVRVDAGKVAPLVLTIDLDNSSQAVP